MTYRELTELVQPLVSIVVPVFNTEPYLEECLSSIQRQTYQNWKAIIVNNCSTDRSGAIADRFAQSDCRFRVVHCSEFLGQLDNYNRAMGFIDEAAKYCKMIESDNWIYPDCLEKMVAMAERDEEVAIVGSYYLQGTAVRGSGLSYKEEIVSGRQVCRMQLLGSFYFWGSPTCLLYRGDVVRARHPFFNSQALHADRDVCYEILERSSFGFVHQLLSFLREGNESISTSIARYNPHLLSKVMDLHQYGSLYLTDKEFDKALRFHERIYFNYLGLSWLVRRDESAFWAHHERGLKVAGIILQRRWLPWWGLRAILDELVRKPKAMFDWVQRTRESSNGKDRNSEDYGRDVL